MGVFEEEMPDLALLVEDKVHYAGINGRFKMSREESAVMEKRKWE